MVTNVAAAISNSESAAFGAFEFGDFIHRVKDRARRQERAKHQIILCRISLYPAECLLLSGQFCRLMLAHAL